MGGGWVPCEGVLRVVWGRSRAEGVRADLWVKQLGCLASPSPPPGAGSSWGGWGGASSGHGVAPGVPLSLLCSVVSFPQLPVCHTGHPQLPHGCSDPSRDALGPAWSPPPPPGEGRSGSCLVSPPPPGGGHSGSCLVPPPGVRDALGPAWCVSPLGSGSCLVSPPPPGRGTLWVLPGVPPPSGGGRSGSCLVSSPRPPRARDALGPAWCPLLWVLPGPPPSQWGTLWVLPGVPPPPG